MNSDIRTVVNFFRKIATIDDAVPVLTVQLRKTLPNAAVGQSMSYDHPQMAKCLNGRITNIQQVIYVSEKTDPPLTYIDVEVV